MFHQVMNKVTLRNKVIKMLPKNIPPEAIEDVEYDLYDGENDGPSYWVYLAPGWICPEMECHTIHEDTLIELQGMIWSIKPWPNDPELNK